MYFFIRLFLRGLVVVQIRPIAEDGQRELKIVPSQAMNIRVILIYGGALGDCPLPKQSTCSLGQDEANTTTVVSAASAEPL
jgi:hypothetical protein